MRLPILWLVGTLVLVALPTSTSAQESAAMGKAYRERRGTGAVEVTFFVDDLEGSTRAATGDLLRRPPGAVRVGLLRPRLTFVPELVKSADSL